MTFQRFRVLALAVILAALVETTTAAQHTTCATRPPDGESRERFLLQHHHHHHNTRHLNNDDMDFTDKQYSIPVHFTVMIAADGRGNDLTDEQIETNLMANLNHGFRDSPFTFELGGVQRATPNDNHFKCNMENEEEFKTMYRVGEEAEQHILNVYLCNYFALGRFGQFGEASYPLDDETKFWRDGVMLMNPSLPKQGNSMLMGQNILIHEVGHWLGLYHTFQGGCDEHPEEGGDFVLDTPAHDGPTKAQPGGKQCWLGLDTGPVDTCIDADASNTDLVDPVSNYMNYVIYRDGDPGECYDRHGHFTPGQVQRMVEQYEQYRLQPAADGAAGAITPNDNDPPSTSNNTDTITADDNDPPSTTNNTDNGSLTPSSISTETSSASGCSNMIPLIVWVGSMLLLLLLPSS